MTESLWSFAAGILTFAAGIRAVIDWIRRRHESGDDTPTTLDLLR